MNYPKVYENFPINFVLGSTILTLIIYLIGTYIVFLIGAIWLILYIIFILILELRLMKLSCTHCFYYGKLCAFGKGRLSSIFFKKGSPEKFIEKQINWKDILPDFLVSIIPLAIGTVLLIIEFDWMLLILVIILFILAFPVNGFLRGSLACKYCKQREIGCPAEQLFNKKKS
jgi:hypothetical protein